jgi:hypothetical protein
MISFHLRWRQDQSDSISKLPGTKNANIRQAIDDYIKKMIPDSLPSRSKRKGDN